MKLRIIKVVILVVGLLVGVRVLDLYFRFTNQRYMYWRFYHGAPVVQLAMVFDVMAKTQDPKLEELNRFLSFHVGNAAFQRAASMAVSRVLEGDYRYMPFITNVLLCADVELVKRKYMMYEVSIARLPNSIEWYKQIASETNEIVSCYAKEFIGSMSALNGAKINKVDRADQGHPSK